MAPRGADPCPRKPVARRSRLEPPRTPPRTALGWARVCGAPKRQDAARRCGRAATLAAEWYIYRVRLFFRKTRRMLEHERMTLLEERRVVERTRREFADQIAD